MTAATIEISNQVAVSIEEHTLYTSARLTSIVPNMHKRGVEVCVSKNVAI